MHVCVCVCIVYTSSSNVSSTFIFVIRVRWVKLLFLSKFQSDYYLINYYKPTLRYALQHTAINLVSFQSLKSLLSKYANTSYNALWREKISISQMIVNLPANEIFENTFEFWQLLSRKEYLHPLHGVNSTLYCQSTRSTLWLYQFKSKVANCPCPYSPDPLLPPPLHPSPHY